jgi:general secretion pathway protein F
VVVFFALGANPGALLSLIGPVILALIGFMVFPALRKTSRWTRLGTLLDDLLLRLPVVGARSERADRVRTIGALASALDAGVPLSLAWELAADAPDSDRRRNAMVAQQRRVTRGGLVSEALEATGIFDASYIESARSGELTGNLPETLWRAVEYDRKEAALIGELTPWVLGLIAYTLYLIVGAYAVIAGWGGLH